MAKPGTILVGNGTGYGTQGPGSSGRAIIYNPSTPSGLDSAAFPSATKDAFVGGDVANSTTAMANVTGLAFAIAANANWTVEFKIYAAGSLGGMLFQLTGPASPTNVLIFTQGDTTGVTLISTDSQSAFSTPTQAYVSGAFSGFVTIHATIENGANPGTVQLQFASNTVAQTNTIKRGSFMRARLVA
jgi:hypothetical protein